MIVRSIRSSKLFPVLLISILIFFVYHSILGHKFVWDDHDFIQHWSELSTLSVSDIFEGAGPQNHSEVYRPIRNLIYRLTVPHWQNKPQLFHVNSVIIHILISAIVYFLSLQISKSKTTATITTLIFSTHPIQTESVAWIAASFDLYSPLFQLASLLFLSQYLNKRHKPLLYSSYIFFGLATYSNESAISTTFTISLFLFLFSKLNNRTKIKLLAPYYFITFSYWLIRFNIIGSLSRLSIPWSISNHLILILTIFGKYLSLLISPVNLNINHQIQDGINSLFFLDTNLTNYALEPTLNLHVVIATIFIATTFLLIFKLPRFKSLFFSLSFIPISLLPVLQIIPQPSLFQEKYAYLATFGFSLTFAQLISPKINHNLVRMFFVLLILFYSGSTFSRIQIWQSDLTLFSFSLVQNPNSASTLNSLAAAYANNSNPQTAILLLESAVAKNPQISIYHRNLILQYQLTNQIDKLISTYKQLAISYPQAPMVHLALGDIYYQLELYDLAHAYYQQALILDSGNSYSINQLRKTTQKIKSQEKKPTLQ